MRVYLIGSVMLALLLSACGFHLRGQATYVMPFKTLHIRSANEFAPFIIELKRAIQAQGVQLTPMTEAQLVLHVASETINKQILSLSGAGRVLEFQLSYQVMLRVYDRQQQDWVAPLEINLRRNLPYDDTQVLAKEAEEALLYQDMRKDAVQQIVRRLHFARAPEVAPPPEIAPSGEVKTPSTPDTTP